MNLIPYSRYARTVLNCEKRPFLREFLDKPDTPLGPWHSSGISGPPGVGENGFFGLINTQATILFLLEAALPVHNMFKLGESHKLQLTPAV